MANTVDQPKEFWKTILCELSAKSRVAGEDQKGTIDSSGKANNQNMEINDVQSQKKQSVHNEPLTHEDKVKKAMELKERRR